jgi:hypothetical protein
MTGMTLKQYGKHRFLRLLSMYGEAKKHIGSEEGNAAFVALSVQIHAAKAEVPRSWWPMINRA